ncbi:hypothetical protein IQ06DRAFT_291576 [Phaeosphaeriaceae sp. SRC1lsM3a]|nr:hypothetical protein IQ06DRAFT_291576 [Stagonospora sp. SRC1lsM3a]
MPSFFSKLTGSSKRNNPYANPNHPSRAPLPQKTVTNSQPNEELRPASPRDSVDYLAEARLAVNRDPVTGKTLSQSSMPQSSGRQEQAQSSAAGRGAAEPSAYASRASQSPQTMGTRYDLFTMEERKRMEREEKIRIARGGQEFYAPERRIGEFYAGGVRDW